MAAASSASSGAGAILREPLHVSLSPQDAWQEARCTLTDTDITIERPDSSDSEHSRPAAGASAGAAEDAESMLNLAEPVVLNVLTCDVVDVSDVADQRVSHIFLLKPPVQDAFDSSQQTDQWRPVFLACPSAASKAAWLEALWQCRALPPRPAEGSFVQDNSGCMDNNHLVLVQGLCKSVLSSCGIPIVVCSLSSGSIKERSDRDVARTLFYKWGVGGHGGWHIGILLLCVQLGPPNEGWRFVAQFGADWADEHGSCARVDREGTAAIAEGARALLAGEPIFKALVAALQRLVALAMSLETDLVGIVRKKPQGWSGPAAAFCGGRALGVGDPGPIPVRPAQGNWEDCLVDCAGLLTANERAVLRRAVMNSPVALCFCTLKRPIGVMARTCDAKDRMRVYATAVFNMFGVGGPDDRGVLIVVFERAGPVVVMGRGYDDAKASALESALERTITESAVSNGVPSAVLRAVEDLCGALPQFNIAVGSRCSGRIFAGGCARSDAVVVRDGHRWRIARKRHAELIRRARSNTKAGTATGALGGEKTG